MLSGGSAMRAINTTVIFLATLWAADFLTSDGMYFRAFRELLALSPH